jgi:hypothetical protein
MKDFEKFPDEELGLLRTELLQSGFDSFQAGELLTGFLVQRGYGVSSEEARDAAAHIEAQGCALPCLQEELEKLAYFM